MNFTPKFLSLISLLCISVSLLAQRPDDHFMRRRVVNRLDMEEKVNLPLIRRASHYDLDQSRFTYKKGIPHALLTAMEQGKFVAYHPDDLHMALSWADVQGRMQEIDPYQRPSDPDWTDDSEISMEEWENDEWTDSFTEEFEDLSVPQNAGITPAQQPDDFAAYEMVIQFVEDWIFDKNLSDLVYKKQFIELIWVDPGGALPDKVLATFKWDEVEETLAQTQWPNRFNEAANLSVKEVFDLRIFNSFLVDVSGNGMRTLDEAERWRQQLVEFEHNLYSY